MHSYNHERDRTRHEKNDPHNCTLDCAKCNENNAAAPKLQCKTCKPTSYLKNRELRSEIADMLEQLAAQLRGNKKIVDPKDWQAKLLAGEPSTIEHTYLLFVYHVGYYLEKYGNLEIFANYAIEGRHQISAAHSQPSRGSCGRQQITTKAKTDLGFSQPCSLP